MGVKSQMQLAKSRKVPCFAGKVWKKSIKSIDFLSAAWYS